MSNWPSSLPTKQFLGVSEKDDESRLVTAMDAGPATVRNRFTAVSRAISTPIVLTGTQKQAFDTFYRTTLANGTASFTWTDPVTDSPATFRFKSNPEWQCIVPSSTPANRIWKAMLALEILP